MITEQVVFARGSQIADDGSGGSFPVLLEDSGIATSETYEAVPVAPIILQPAPTRSSKPMGGGLTVNTPPRSAPAIAPVSYATPQQQPAQPTEASRRAFAESSLLAGEPDNISSVAEAAESSGIMRRSLWLLLLLIVTYILVRSLRAR